MLDRTIAPQFRRIENINFIKAEKEVLNNNIPLFKINGGDQNLVRIEFLFKNVNWNAEKPLQTAAVNAMLTEGTNNLSAAEIVSEIDYYGAFLQTDYGLDYCSVTLYSLTKHLVSTLPIVKDILTDSIFPEKELTTFCKNQKQKLQVNLERNDFLARRAFNRSVFGNTLYGFAPEESDYENIKRDDLLEFFKKMYRPENCTIVVSGKIADETLELINALFSDWVSNEAPSVENSFSFPQSPGELVLIEKEDALQSAIRLGIPTVNRTHQDYAGLQVLNTVLGGYFGSRLMANIREDKGYTYGIGSANVPYKNCGVFFIASEVGVDVCKNTLEEIQKEIQVLQTVLIPEEELSLVKNYLMGSILGSLENAFSHADKFKSIYFSDLGYDYYDNYIKTIKEISAEKLKDLANIYLKYEDFTKIIVGKM